MFGVCFCVFIDERECAAAAEHCCTRGSHYCMRTHVCWFIRLDVVQFESFVIKIVFKVVYHVALSKRPNIKTQ